MTSFERERPRLVRIAGRLLGDHAEAEGIVQQAWLRLARADQAAIDSLPAWLTTVVTRLCLDRLKAAVPRPLDRWGGSATSRSASPACRRTEVGRPSVRRSRPRPGSLRRRPPAR
ncbi:MULTISPECIES: sigma factor [Dietzia]|uniref:sigma factor n=1 Tax=Dietzia TaxID=37914 RepID=UPI00352B2992